MSRAVFDANAFASGVLRYHHASSTPAALLRRWLTGGFELLTSDALVREVERTLADTYFAARVDPRDADLLLTALRTKATEVTITATVAGVATHPEDDLVLAAAVSAAADYLVTGDKQLQRLGGYQGVTILSPRDFLTRLQQQEAADDA